MSAVYEPVRLAYRMQLERVHVQGSLLDDPPVLIRAFPLPVPTVPLAARGTPLTASVAPAAHNTNGTRRSTCPGSAAGASQETS